MLGFTQLLACRPHFNTGQSTCGVGEEGWGAAGRATSLPRNHPLDLCRVTGASVKDAEAAKDKALHGGSVAPAHSYPTGHISAPTSHGASQGRA